MELSKLITRLSAVSLVALTAACSSTSSSTTGSGTLGSSGEGVTSDPDPVVEADPAADFSASMALALQDQNRIAPFGLLVSDDGDPATPNGIQGTRFENLNRTTSGTADYTGPGIVEIFNRTPAAQAGAAPIDTIVVEMLGTATVTFDFAPDEFTGRIEALEARNAAGEIASVEGTVNIINGDQLNPANRPTLIGADATGLLDVFGQTYTIDVDLTGLLRGGSLPATPEDITVRAITLQGEGPGNGTSLVNIEVVGDRNADNVGSFVNQ